MAANPLLVRLCSLTGFSVKKLPAEYILTHRLRMEHGTVLTTIF